MDRVYKGVVRTYERLANPTIVVVFLLLALFFALYLFPRSTDSFTARGGPIHLQMQLEHRPSRWAELWDNYSGSIESAVHEYRMHLLRLDFVFPVVYVIFLLSAIASLTNEPGKDPSKSVLILFQLPVLGGIFDWAENLMHITGLQGVKSIEDLNNLPDHVVQLSFVFTVLKGSLTVGSLGIATLLCVYRRFFKTH